MVLTFQLYFEAWKPFAHYSVDGSTIWPHVDHRLGCHMAKIVGDSLINTNQRNGSCLLGEALELNACHDCKPVGSLAYFLCNNIKNTCDLSFLCYNIVLPFHVFTGFWHAASPSGVCPLTTVAERTSSKFLRNQTGALKQKDNTYHNGAGVCCLMHQSVL